MIKRIFKKNWPIISLIILSSFIVWPTFLPGFFFHHDDLQVMRIFEMRKCLEDFQIPCRWVPDMGYGNGYPLFNYYGVLPYYIGGILSFIFGFVGAAKALFFIPLVLGGIAMYFLGKELFGSWGGFTSAVLYQFAPYRALDSYVRGAIAESFALAIIPLVFYFSLQIIKESNLKNFLGMTLSLAAFFLSHNIMTLFFIPVLVVWNIYFLLKTNFKNLKPIVISHFLGFGLAGFFIVPAFLEKDLVKSESLIQGGTEFRAHFVSVGQLFFDRAWGYGASVFGPNDTISFQIGWPHWWIVGLSTLFMVYGIWSRIKKRETKAQNLFLNLFLLTLCSMSIILMHNKSAPIWEALSLLQFAQFPWRLLSITIFVSSLIGGLVIFMLPKKYQLYTALLIVIVTVALNWQFFKPKDFYPWVDDNIKLSDPLWEIQQKAGIGDYLPKTVWLEPQSRAPGYPEIRKGKVEVENFKIYTDNFESKIKVTEEAIVEYPVLDFPEWKLRVNGKEYKHYIDDKWGRISLELPQGEYQINGKLHDTPIRMAANLITLFSFVGVVLLIILRSNSKVKKLLS
jgi:hypothetical protein